MTYKIAASMISSIPNFAVLVQQHSADVKHWRGHMARVDDDMKNSAPVEKAHAPFGRPMAHPLVCAAVNESDEPDFEIVDDGPTPDQALAEKKNRLIGLVSAAENEAISAVLPRGRARYYQIRESDIHAGIIQPSLLSKIKSAIGFTATAPSISADDEQFLKDQSARRERYDAITRLAAKAHSDIEDLTADTIGAWQMPKFPD